MVCAICLEKLFEPPKAKIAKLDNPTSWIVSTPCGHVFHKHCIEEWFMEQPQTQRKSSWCWFYELKGGSCPSCKAFVDQDSLRRLYVELEADEPIEDAGFKALAKKYAELRKELLIKNVKLERLEKSLRQGGENEESRERGDGTVLEKDETALETDLEGEEEDDDKEEQKCEGKSDRANDISDVNEDKQNEDKQSEKDEVD